MTLDVFSDFSEVGYASICTRTDKSDVDFNPLDGRACLQFHVGERFLD